MSRLGSKPQVLSLSAHTLQGVFAEIELLGEATRRLPAARSVTQALHARVKAVSALPALPRRPRVLCLEWLDPLFQGGHWIPEMVELAGAEAVLATTGEKSVRIGWEKVAEADPEIVVVMPCGYHLAETVAQFNATPRPPCWNTLTAVREGRVYAVDGTAYFSRPGPRLVDGLEILAAIFHGESFAALPPGSVARL
jgi:iron complex transport system substrate-binding protein